MDMSAASSLALPRNGHDPAQFKADARRTAEDFEMEFLGTMLNSMFEGLETEPPFGGGHAEETYRSMMVSEFAGTIARTGGIGVADHVYREILAAQEGATS